MTFLTRVGALKVKIFRIIIHNLNTKITYGTQNLQEYASTCMRRTKTGLSKKYFIRSGMKWSGEIPILKQLNGIFLHSAILQLK